MSSPYLRDLDHRGVEIRDGERWVPASSFRVEYVRVEVHRLINEEGDRGPGVVEHAGDKYEWRIGEDD